MRSYDPYGALLKERQEIRGWGADSAVWHPVEIYHAYDLNGRRNLSWVDGTGDWELDPCEPSVEIDPPPCGYMELVASDSIMYRYNAVGNLWQVENTLWNVTKNTGNRTWTYGYDDKNRLETLSVPLMSGYRTVTRVYDNDDRLLTHTTSGGGPYSSVSQYDAAGRPLTASFSGAQVTYSYDALGQLLTESGNGTSETFTYDSSGNRLSSSGGIDYVYHATRGWLSSTDDGSCETTYEYDANGNQTDQIPGQSCSGVERTMTYDIGNRMTEAVTLELVGGDTRETTRTYWYDGLGRRILTRTEYDGGQGSPPADVGTWRYWWFEDNVAVKTWNYNDSAYVNMDWPEIERDGNDLTGFGEWFYYGPGPDNLLGSWGYDNPQASSPSQHLFFKDWRGSVVQVTDSTGAGLGLTASAYQAFGGESGSSGSAADINPGYNGHESSGGLVYMRNRWYDPNTGRFTQEDPIGYAGGINLYGYVGNNPVMYADPFGLCPDDQRDAQGDCPEPPGGPPVPLPDGRNGEKNSWRPLPGTEERAVKWIPKFPVPSEQGGQPSGSWDRKHGHWDVDDGSGTRRRYGPDGGEVSHRTFGDRLRDLWNQGVEGLRNTVDAIGKALEQIGPPHPAMFPPLPGFRPIIIP